MMNNDRVLDTKIENKVHNNASYDLIQHITPKRNKFHNANYIVSIDMTQNDIFYAPL